MNANSTSSGISAVTINSNQDSDENTKSWDKIESGEAKIVFVSPERFLSEGFVAFVASKHNSLVCIDEVHCILEWGESFRPGGWTPCR